MSAISKIDTAAEKTCNILSKDHSDVWYCLDGYSAYIWLTPWNTSGQPRSSPAYKITNKLECIPLVLYPFSLYKQDFLKSITSTGRYANEQLQNMYWKDYTDYCRGANLLPEPKPYRHL